MNIYNFYYGFIIDCNSTVSDNDGNNFRKTFSFILNICGFWNCKSECNSPILFWIGVPFLYIYIYNIYMYILI